MTMLLQFVLRSFVNLKHVLIKYVDKENYKRKAKPRQSDMSPLEPKNSSVTISTEDIAHNRLITGQNVTSTTRKSNEPT